MGKRHAIQSTGNPLPVFIDPPLKTEHIRFLVSRGKEFDESFDLGETGMKRSNYAKSKDGFQTVMKTSRYPQTTLLILA